MDYLAAAREGGGRGNSFNDPDNCNDLYNTVGR
jgi:hypothetical protein